MSTPHPFHPETVTSGSQRATELRRALGRAREAGDTALERRLLKELQQENATARAEARHFASLSRGEQRRILKEFGRARAIARELEGLFEDQACGHACAPRETLAAYARLKNSLPSFMQVYLNN